MKRFRIRIAVKLPPGSDLLAALTVMYGLSVASYWILLTPDLVGILVAIGVSLGIWICAALVLLFGYPAHANPPSIWITRWQSKRLSIFWWISAIATLVATADLLQSAYLTTLVRDEVTLGTLRGDFFQTEDFRSLTGKICGLLFVPFALLSAVKYRLDGRWIPLISAFVLAAMYSLLMGGRGQIIFFVLAIAPAMLRRLSITKIAVAAICLLYGLELIHTVRTPDIYQNRSGSSIAQYISTPWYGLNLLLTSEQSEYATDLFHIGAPFPLDEIPFAIFGNYGNLYGGMGHLVHTFGILGAPLYFLMVTSLFLCALRVHARSLLEQTILQYHAFMYFGFLIFHDMTIFYSSFLGAFLLIPALRIRIKGSRLQDIKSLPSAV